MLLGALNICSFRPAFRGIECRLVFNYYEALTAKVLVSKSDLTKPFHYAIGVFQGCVLSPARLTFVFNHFSTPLEKFQRHVVGHTHSKVI